MKIDPSIKPRASLSVSQATAVAAVLLRDDISTDGARCNEAWNKLNRRRGLSPSPSGRLKSRAYHEEPVWAFVSPFPSLLAIRLPPAHLAAPGSPLSAIRRSYQAAPCASSPGGGFQTGSSPGEGAPTPPGGGGAYCGVAIYSPPCGNPRHSTGARS